MTSSPSPQAMTEEQKPSQKIWTIARKTNTFACGNGDGHDALILANAVIEYLDSQSLHD